MDVMPRTREGSAFLDATTGTAPQTVSACEGWTAHEIAAHVTGICVEISRHLRPWLEGDPVPETRSFEEREAPLQALAHDALLARLDTAEQEVRRDLSAVLAREPDAVIPWTGRQMAVAKFVPHLRNEFSLHRWDIVGEDDVSDDLLAQPDLTAHSVEVLGEILLRRGREHDPCPDEDLAVCLRSEESDVFVVVEDGTAALSGTAPASYEHVIDLTAPSRALFIWGRRPDHRGRVRSGLDPAVLSRVQTLLSGY